uniref:Uncharacterized protein n=1 Tax=Arundo donax TaxID=35708 RepID=A0A0A9BLV6_ARUDO
MRYLLLPCFVKITRWHSVLLCLHMQFKNKQHSC